MYHIFAVGKTTRGTYLRKVCGMEGRQWSWKPGVSGSKTFSREWNWLSKLQIQVIHSIYQF